MTLFVAALDIGNPEDIPNRTIKHIKTSDIIICEYIGEFKIFASRLKLDISQKTIIEFNPYISMPEKRVQEIVNFHNNGKQIILLSNDGTPLITDPGFEIVAEFRKNNLPVYSIPGPSSVIAALSTSGVLPNNFYFGGFMPLASKERIEYLINIKQNAKCAIVILESMALKSYQSVLDIKEVFGENAAMSIHISMTSDDDKTFFSSIKNCTSWIDEIINSKTDWENPTQNKRIVYVIDNWPTTYQQDT